ncbi:MAG TPA: lipocalin-like domain-containing protein [Pyrinomonadaceae bacterium]|nr:lipocalin-like domain-containing protein [Pyrinomonadaceae bacterium]
MDPKKALIKKSEFIALIVLLLVIPLFSFAQNRAGNKKIARKVVGTWKLIAIEATRPTGEVFRDWGHNPTGLIIYDSGGRMAVQFIRDLRPKATSNNLTTNEMKTAFDGYYAYFGTYQFDEKEGTVTHHVQGSLRPFEVGADYKRFYKLSGDRLTLSTPPMRSAAAGSRGEQRIYSLTWERVK